MKLCSRLLACAIHTFAMVGCNAPSTNQAAEETPSLAQLACLRKDVQDVVSNEVKSIFQKGFYEHAGTALLLIDPREISAEFEQARTSFHHVGVASGAEADKFPIEQVVCIGTLQIDESNSKQGQQILQVPELRWSIEFAQPVNDPQASAFSITLDRGSLADGMRFNGKPIEALRNQVEKPRSTQPLEEDTRPIDSQADAERDAGVRAADAAGDAAADAQAAADEAERELNAELEK